MKRAYRMVAVCLLGLGRPAWSELPPPSAAMKAKADEAAAKAKWSDNVAAYQLCEAQNKVASFYYAQAKDQDKPTSPPVDTPPCVDPGPFTAVPPDTAASADRSAASAKESN
ncbi:MAG: hypothetical protein HIU89_00525 [Proteobacteria bacterium]|nr:hypothetical protein [Pseudomonadota bacterium]